MEIIVKYKVDRPFTDKNTKEDIMKNKVIDISIERMKELNKHNVGRVEDIVIIEDTPEEKVDKNTKEEGEKTEKHTKEDLEKLTVNQLKELAEQEKIELTKAKKEEIIKEILQKQN